MTWPDVPALELLVAVADHGSLSAAARACSVAQPNASRSLARLERQCGLSLLTRATTGATLTAEGRLVVGWARQLLAVASEFTAGVVALQQDTKVAPLRVMASQTIANYLLPRWIGQWRAGADRGPIAVSVGNSAEVLAAARTGQIDVGFVEGPGAPRGLNSLTVATDELVLCTAPHTALARRATVGADDLADLSLVCREDGSGTRVALARALSPRVPAPPLLELTSNAAVRVSVMAGTGPAVLSRLTIGDALESGDLVEVPVPDLDLRRKLRAVWAGPRAMTNPAAASLVSIARMTGAQ